MLSSQKLLSNLPALCNMVRRIAIEAGEITLEYFDDVDGTDYESKEDGSPVSLADEKAEALIIKRLQELMPDVPIVGEESVASGQIPSLQDAPYFWLVDPLDGTKEFISGRGDYTVNIALIHNHEPVLGVVSAPAHGVLYAGCEGKAIKWSEETNKEKDISVRPPPKEGLIVMASKSHGDNQILEEFLDQFKVAKLSKRGSSLKICSIAERKADLYPRFGPTCEWDTAAAHAVLIAAGGCLTTKEGEALRYGLGLNEKFLNPEFIASSFAWWEEAETSS